MLHPAAQPAARSLAGKPASAAASSSPTSTPGVDLTNTFLQLLTVQLKNQSPLDPLDPNQFVVQLAQFDSLGELTQIQELVQTLVNDVKTTSAASGANNSTSTSIPNSISH